MKVDLIRKRLQVHRPSVVAGNGYERAAVALILREGNDGAEFVAIRRSEREGDPWSGHMALPGGRQHYADQDLVMTAARETHEEVGIDLMAQGELVGRLDDVFPSGGGGAVNLVITPFVFTVHTPVRFLLDRNEVDRALWVPLAFLKRREAQGHIRRTIAGQEAKYQAYVFQGHAIWGLTYRILTQFLALLEEQYTTAGTPLR